MLEGAALKGRYRLDRLMEGSAGHAGFEATDLQAGRNVVVRVVAFPPHTSREEAAARDRARERAAVAARLRHPNLVVVDDVGRDEPLGVDFVVTELLRGEDLEQQLRREGSPSWQSASRILHEAASGLGASHRAGLVHGGITSSRLFLERGPDGRVIRTRVLDLAGMQLTAVGGAKAAPGPEHPSPYAAPEQRRGEGPSAATDVWALAVVAYEMLTSTLPFTEQQHAVLAKGLRMQPSPPSRLNPAVPLAADALITRSLSLRPEERPSDGEAFSRELDTILRGGQPAASPPPVASKPEIPSSPAKPAAVASTPLPAAPSPATKPQRRSRTFIFASSTVAVVALAAAALVSEQRSRQAAAYFASAPIAPSRTTAPGEIDYIRQVYRRIEDGGADREWRMELGRLPKYEWPSSDSAHAHVYQDGYGTGKIRVRVYEDGERTAWLFYYDGEELVFVHQVAPSGGGRDAEQRFYFRDHALIRWRDTRNDIVPLDSGHDEFSRKLQRISDHLLEMVAARATR